MSEQRKGTRTGARRCALQALYQWQLTGQPLEAIERQFVQDRLADGARLDYFSQLLHGVVEHLDAIDAALTEFSDRPVDQIDPIERAILRLAAYELLYRWEVPYRAVLNEAINLAKVFGATHKSYKYVNGVLDRLAHKVRAREIQAAR
ncbi:transcription antitermination protein NusB [Methylomarinovum caldicuralii]|uniref:Transcription antitermination protein NusB n=1 Tax=Methylomarinovum caldicuralii TaxID=438856 RepID=A0AAU9CBC8_9GAMM|nr:transcription antitermination factor NusB [Methylomarinovum caldicuralii]BCX81814.1 transcription antitermination protein NusB [Methylomarinovum caldicuralii]